MATGVPGSTVLVPDQPTASEMVRYVLNYTQTPRDSDNFQVALDALNAGVDELNETTWNEIVGSQDITLVASTRTYSINTEFKAPRHASLLDSSSNKKGRLHYKAFKTFLREHPLSDSDGDPLVYTIRYDTRNFEMDRAPTSGFISTYPTVRLFYFRRLAHLAQDGDTLGAVPAEFSRFVMRWGRYEWALVQGDVRMADRARTEAERTRTSLKRSDTNTVTDWSDVR